MRELAHIASAEHMDRAFVDLSDARCVHGALQEIRMLLQVGAQVRHAFGTQAFEQLGEAARVDTPEGDRHVVK
ncbi:MAG TPA: hypothetical protein VGI22_05690 [Xanthobacteraceae bacterium]